MPGKTLIPTEGNLGGIEAGSPFQIDHATFVSSVSPPFINTGRFARINDATQSLIAYGVNAGAHSFVVGENVVDSVNGDRAILVGYNIQQNAPGSPLAAADQVIVGSNIAVPLTSTDARGLVAIGASQTFTGFVGVANTFGNSILIGYQAKLICANIPLGEASNDVVVGASASATQGGSVVVGTLAQATSSEGTAVGQISVAALQSVSVGSKATSAQRGVSVGWTASSADSCVAIGYHALAIGGADAIAIGRDASTSTTTGSMAFGRGTLIAPGFNNLALFGSTTVPIFEFRFGSGHNLNTGGVVYTLTVTDRDTTNNAAGNSLVIRAGLGTGTWTNAENLGIDLQVGLAVGAGNAQQTASSVFAARHSDLNAALWGGLTAPFNNGKKVLYVANATTPPTAAAVAGGGILYVTGGELHFLSSAGVDYAITPGGGGGTITGGGTPGTLATWTGATAIGDTDAGVDTTMAVDGGQVGVFALGGVSLIQFKGSGFSPTVNAGVASGDAAHVWANVYTRGLISDVGLTVQAASLEALAFVAGATALNASVFGGPTADFAGGDGVLQLAPAATAPSAAPTDVGAVLLWTALYANDSVATLNVALNRLNSPGYLVLGSDGIGEPGIGYELFSSPGDRYGLISRANGAGGVYIGFGVLGGSGGATAEYIGMYIRASSPNDVILYWDDTYAFPYLGTGGSGEADLGAVGQEWRDLLLIGKIKQTGIDGAGATALAITNAPNANTPVWVPEEFNGGAGWRLVVPA